MKHYFLLMASALLLNSCKKSDSAPKPTQNGANTLWYDLNGQTHSYEGKPDYIYGAGVRILAHNLGDSVKGFLIIASNRTKYDDNLQLYITMPGSTDTSITVKYPSINTPYKLSENFYMQSIYTYGTEEFFVDTTNSTIVFTRFDENVAAGTFEFHGFNYNNEPIAITKGFFDISRK